MSGVLQQYYRCPEQVCTLAAAPNLPEASGFFRFGADVIAFGQCKSGVASKITRNMPDALIDVETDQCGNITLPFDPAVVLENLRYEHYASHLYGSSEDHSPFLQNAYYAVRPLFP